MQTIPARFVDANQLQGFQHAILRRMDTERRVVLKFEFHPESPWRNDHMTLRTNWKILAGEFNFPMNKMIRFQLVGTTLDPDFEVELFNGPIPLVPIFDVC